MLCKILLLSTLILLTHLYSSAQEDTLRHRFGAGASYAGGDEIFENSVLLTGLYEYRLNHWFGVEANFGMFQSNYIAGAIKFNPVNTIDIIKVSMEVCAESS